MGSEQSGTVGKRLQWDFDDVTFDRSAASFDNPDHVNIVIYNYRWRLGLAAGEPNYDDLEKRLADYEYQNESSTNQQTGR